MGDPNRVIVTITNNRGLLLEKFAVVDATKTMPSLALDVLDTINIFFTTSDRHVDLKTE